MKRRGTLCLMAGAALAPPLRAQPASGAGPASTAPRVLRYAFPIAESGFDPAQISDTYSRNITAHLFEALYAFDHLARPARVFPLTAAEMPLVEDDYRRWTVKIRPGIFFTDDPAFKGAKRELVAADYVYAFKRFADPAVKSPMWTSVDQLGFIGLAALRREALAKKQPFDYDKPVAGLRVIDRTTVQFVLEEPQPRFMDTLVVSDLFGAMAREVCTFYGERIAEHPVGTGPYRLAQWRRSSLIVLERNPGYRERYWDCQPAAADAEGQAIAAKLRGRRIPLIDRVEVSIIEESQPRWLSFVNGQSDFIDRMPPEFIDVAMPGGKLAPNLARQGIQGHKVLQPDITMTYFNMEDPVVGGYAPHQVALRRAINLSVDLVQEITFVRRGMAIPAQGPLMPHLEGYDPAFKSEMSEYNPAKAKALLDLYGYVDRNGDGWRELPDGQPLLLNCAAQPDQQTRQLSELRQKNLKAIGIRVAFKVAKWPENLKAARAGKLQMWGVASTASGGDGQSMLARFHGRQAGQQNLSRFALPEFDTLYERIRVMPNGPERRALMKKATRIVVAYAPYKLHVHRYVADLTQPGVIGFRRPPFWNGWWHLIDVDPALRHARGAAA